MVLLISFAVVVVILLVTGASLVVDSVNKLVGVSEVAASSLVINICMVGCGEVDSSAEVVA